MANQDEVRDFLTSRRAKLTPVQAGIPQTGRRRVPGLRRGEVAALAGVSVEYYAHLERGNLSGASAGVLDALAQALQLDDSERVHLLRLAREADGTTRLLRRPRPKAWRIRHELQWVLDAIGTPAIIGNDRLDFLAANHLGKAMYSDVLDSTGKPNFARHIFLDDSAHRFYPRWDLAADTAVANLRTAAGKDPHDEALHELVGELSTRSEEFRHRWQAHDVRIHGAGTKLFHHHAVGDLELAYESLDLRSDPGHTMTIYSAEPTSPSAARLNLLATQAVEVPTEHDVGTKPAGNP